MNALPHQPSLYEINTRVWLRQFDTPSNRASLDDVPDILWDELADKGIHIIWLMGVWKINAQALRQRDMIADLTIGYDAALPDWTEEDVIGSPYAVDDYVVADDLGGNKAIKRLHCKLQKRGLRLMLDFVPNHFSQASHLVNDRPEVFIHHPAEQTVTDSSLYFAAKTGDQFAFGRDPLFAPWGDTAQVNYAAAEARQYMQDSLLKIADLCDGVRCDMAMLMLNDIFSRTWHEHVDCSGLEQADEFWQQAISVVKESHNGFIFMAEAYWDTEWRLQQLGFNYTYDKRLTDLLHESNVAAIKGHLHADQNYQQRSVRFLENHDETRAVAALGRDRSLAAAVIVSTLQGMHFYHDGQFQGLKVRVPVQLGRAPIEEVDSYVEDYYQRILEATKAEIFTDGDWQLLAPQSAWSDNNSHNQMLAWHWQRENEHRIVVVNYSETLGQCRLFFDAPQQEIYLTDILNHTNYERDGREIKQSGLFVELGAYQSHIFAF